MPELRRFGGINAMVAVVGMALVILVMLGLFVFGVRAGGSGVTTEPVPALTGPTEPGSPEPAGSSGGTSAAPGTGPFDPDQSVSSEDPPVPPRVQPSPVKDGIDSFEDCANAGYPIAESYPEQCFTPDGRGFTREI